MSLPDGTRVEFTRFASDADLQITPEAMHYSSSPSAVAQANAQAMLADVLGLALQGALPGIKSAPPPYRPQALLMSEDGL